MSDRAETNPQKRSSDTMNVVTYLRVSSEQQAERQLSIPAQTEALPIFLLARYSS